MAQPTSMLASKVRSPILFMLRCRDGLKPPSTLRATNRVPSHRLASSNLPTGRSPFPSAQRQFARDLARQRAQTQVTTEPSPDTPNTSLAPTHPNHTVRTRPSPWEAVKLFLQFDAAPPFRDPDRPRSQFNGLTNPWRARKRWPPDFRTLHRLERFRYEKTFRRRIEMKWVRPKFNRWMALLQYALFTIVIVQALFWVRPGGEGDLTAAEWLWRWGFGEDDAEDGSDDDEEINQEAKRRIAERVAENRDLKARFTMPNYNPFTDPNRTLGHDDWKESPKKEAAADS